jgi:hypothetical protein
MDPDFVQSVGQLLGRLGHTDLPDGTVEEFVEWLYENEDLMSPDALPGSQVRAQPEPGPNRKHDPVTPQREALDSISDDDATTPPPERSPPPLPRSDPNDEEETVEWRRKVEKMAHKGQAIDDHCQQCIQTLSEITSGKAPPSRAPPRSKGCQPQQSRLASPRRRPPPHHETHRYRRCREIRRKLAQNGP